MRQVQGAPLEVAINAALTSGHFELETAGGLPALMAKATIPPLWLHLNACGDFTLLHRDAWAKILGYAEFEMFSMHLDSFGMVTAHFSGFHEIWLAPLRCAFISSTPSDLHSRRRIKPPCLNESSDRALAGSILTWSSLSCTRSARSGRSISTPKRGDCGTFLWMKPSAPANGSRCGKCQGVAA